MSIRWENNLDLSRLLTAVDEATPEALDEGIEHIRAVAVERTPYETGRLAGSATPNVDPEKSEASLTFEGPYARYQHEKLDLHHEVGRSKFLESALTDEAQTAIDIIAKRIERSL